MNIQYLRWAVNCNNAWIYMESLYTMLQYGALFVKWSASREKVPNILSHCHSNTKRRMGARGCAHLSFGMPLTQDIRGVFM